jgi:mycothiol system anti-sigma-R factor
MSGDDCDKLLHAVYAYLDGAVSEPEKAELALHLRRCRGCNDAVEFERAFLMKIKVSCDENADIPAGLADRIRSALQIGDTPGSQSV